MQPDFRQMNAGLSRSLATQRLTLRPLRYSDLDPLHALLAQPGVRRHLYDDRSPAPDEVAALIAGSRHRFETCGAGSWVVFEMARPATLAGIVGFHGFDHGPGRRSEEEMVFALGESHWGRGLATEAANAVLMHVRDALGWTEAQASVDHGNQASVRTLQRLGFRECADTFMQGGMLRTFRRML